MLETEQHEPMTYGQIKDFLNGLTEDQLKQKAYIWVSDDETATEIHEVAQLGEHMYFFHEHEYSCSRSDFMKDIMRDEDTNEILYQTIDEALAKEPHYTTPADRVYFYSI